ncbi:serine hydrolase [Streptomyces sp. NPDC056400]|uniref:serine hydrolase n=1 Tax=Streptomyces sp. NPDC056400 TaxID=3345808 RepID=UPI0035DAB770
MKAVTVAGGSSDDPEIEAVTTALEGEPEATAGTGTEVEAGADPGSEAAPQADAEPEADSELPGDAGPETDSAPQSAAESEDEADAEADAEPEGETAPGAEPKAQAGSELPHDAESKGAADAGLPGEAEPEDETDPARSAAEADAAEPTTVPEPEAAPQAEPKAQAGSELPHDAESKGAADAGLPGEAEPEDQTDPARSAAEADAAEPKADAEADTEPEAKPKADTGPEGGSEVPDDARPQADAEPEAEWEAESTAASGAEAVAAAPKTDAEANVEPKDETTPRAKPKAQAGSELPHDADPQDAAESQPAGEADAGLPGDAEPEDQTDPARSAAEADAAEPKAVAGPEGGSEVPDDARPEANAASEAEAVATAPKSDAEAGVEPEGEAAPRAKGKGQAGSGLPDDAEPGADAESEGADAVGLPSAARSEADAEPEAEAEAGATARSAAEADGEPSAGDRADTGPEPEADGDVVEAASDETMLISLPKQKPVEPDAPRKAPSWAREVEPDPERTSQFVALKDVDLPAPVAPRAQPHSPEAKVAGQAPAAPLPPLDLLAELTNTRPPAETPRRTALRRVKIWTPILLLLAGAGAGAQLMRPLPAPQLVAAETDRTVDGQFSVPWPAKGQGAVRVSGSGDIGTFGEQKPVPTASVAKVMTAYVILKGHPLRKADPGPDITIDAKTVADGNSEHESRITSLTAGQKFSQQDMLKMLMIPSGNNVARLLARWDTGTDSEAAFVAKMNAAAKELGMANTTYTDPSGLDAGTVSTAVDQLKLAEAVMKDEVFRSIVALPNASIKGLPTRLENNNTLLNNTIRGIKTGSSTPAGGTLMWAAYKSIDGKDQLILGTLMDQRVDGPDEDGGNSLKLVLANSKTIIEGVRTALASAPVIRKGDVVGHVDDGLGGRTPLVATKDLNVIGVPGQKLKLSLTTGGGAGAGAGPLPHSAKAGSEVAVLTVGSGEGARSVPVAVKGALVEPGFGTRLTRGR